MSGDKRPDVYHRQVMARVQCPYCDAKVGEPCVRVRDRSVIVMAHAHRVDALRVGAANVPLRSHPNSVASRATPGHGSCSSCGRDARLRADGTVMRHQARSALGGPDWTRECPGSKQAPASSEASV